MKSDCPVLNIIGIFVKREKSENSAIKRVDEKVTCVTQVIF